MDKMQPWEASLLAGCISYADSIAWETTRFNVYSIASMFSKNKLKISDIVEFPWEKDNPDETDEPETSINKEDIDRLFAMMDRDVKANNI